MMTGNTCEIRVTGKGYQPNQVRILLGKLHLCSLLVCVHYREHRLCVPIETLTYIGGNFETYFNIH